ncbi:MAG: hypothetical protein ACC657_18640, partial [Thiohalomonadales bacterium]
MNTTTEHSVLLVDLNNFARYPTLSIGYLAAILREASFQVSVFSPLMVGVHGTTREVKPTRLSLFGKKLNHLAATSKISWIRSFRNKTSKRHLSEITKQHRFVIEGFKKHLLVTRPQVVVISTYLMYKDLCAEICA